MARRKGRKGQKKGAGGPKGKTEVAATALNRIINRSQERNKNKNKSPIPIAKSRISARYKRKTEKGAAMTKSKREQTEQQELSQRDAGKDEEEEEMKQEQDEKNSPQPKDEEQKGDIDIEDIEEQGQNNIMQQQEQQESNESGNLELGKVKKLYSSSQKTSYFIYPGPHDNQGTPKVATSSVEIDGLKTEFYQYLTERMRNFNDERNRLEVGCPTFLETFKFIEARVPHQVYIPYYKLLELTSSFYDFAVRESIKNYCKMNNQRVEYPFSVCEKNFPEVSDRD